MTGSEIRLLPVADESDWQEARRIREVVFCEEQACPAEEEFDRHDEAARHLLGRWVGEDGGQRTVAVARWRVVEREGEAWAKLERFAILPGWRGRGLGRGWIAAVIDDATRQGHRRFLLHAQAHLEPLYAGLGFATVRGPFTEAGIPHVEMRRRDEAAG